MPDTPRKQPMPQPQDPSAARLAQEVMGMLELRSSTAVPPWMASRLAALWGATATRVLRVFPIAAARRRGTQDRGHAIALDSLDLDVVPEPVGGDEKLHAAIEGRRGVSEEAPGGRGRVLIPLAAADEAGSGVGVSGAAANRAPGAARGPPVELARADPALP